MFIYTPFYRKHQKFNFLRRIFASNPTCCCKLLSNTVPVVLYVSSRYTPEWYCGCRPIIKGWSPTKFDPINNSKTEEIKTEAPASKTNTFYHESKLFHFKLKIKIVSFHLNKNDFVTNLFCNLS